MSQGRKRCVLTLSESDYEAFISESRRCYDVKIIRQGLTHVPDFASLHVSLFTALWGASIRMGQDHKVM